MRRTIVIGLVAMIAVPCLGSGGQRATARKDSGQTEALLKQARSALGGEAKVKEVRSLSLSGKYRRIVGGRDINGDISFDVQLPDKYLKLETMYPAPSVSITSIDLVNGNRVVLDARTSGPGHIIFNRPGTGSASPEAQAAAQRAVMEDFARLMAGWLLTSPSSFPVKFGYIGEAEAPDGKADVLELSGPANFKERLFLDKNTHLPLMLDYSGPAPKNVMQTSNGRESNADIEKKIRDQMAKLKDGDVEFQIHFSDYRPVNGVMLPFHISKAILGQTNEEWNISSYGINPPLSPDKFEKP